MLSLEAEAAIATLRYAFQAAIRKSYFSSANNDIEQTKKNIASLLAAVRKRVAHLGGETVPAGGHRSSLIVLPTGGAYAA